MESHGFNWLSAAGIPEDLNHVAMAGVVAILLLVCGMVASSKLSAAMASREGALVPESKLSFRNIFEIIAEKLYGLTEGVLGHHGAEVYFPLIGTLFMFIFTCNLLGLVPGFLPPTDNINTTLALGVFVFIYYNIEGFKANGIGYLKHFLGPVIWIGWLIGPIEIVSNLFRPLTLGLRLRGNIFADHAILSVAQGVPYLVPILAYGMGIFVSFVQAFVFCLLTMVYISLSTSHDH